MFSKIKITSIVIIFSTLYSCGLLKSEKIVKAEKLDRKSIEFENPNEESLVVINKHEKMTTNERVKFYIKTYAPIAKEEMEKYGIPASITLAQGLLESGMGIGYLAKNGNNHFGIKCHKNWEGKRIYYDDDEKGECFRVYSNAKESYYDHSLFLKTRSRYEFLFELKSNNYKDWAKGLKKAGYATDPKYPGKLIGLIERYNLSRFDKSNSRKKSSKKLTKKEQYQIIHQVEKGDTLFSISKKYNVEIQTIIDENDIKNKTIYMGQKIRIPVKH